MTSLLTFGKKNQEGECQILAHKQWLVDLVNMLASDNNKDQNIWIFTIFSSHARKKRVMEERRSNTIILFLSSKFPLSQLI